MELTLLKSKLHRVHVTHAELDYEGSCAIDQALLELAGIREYEQLHIYNLDNGERFVTYAILAEPGSGIVSVNGAAAHKAKPNHRLIICTYANMSENEADTFKPSLVYIGDDGNKVSHTSHEIDMQH